MKKSWYGRKQLLLLCMYYNHGAEDAEPVILIPVGLPCLERGRLYKKKPRMDAILALKFWRTHCEWINRLIVVLPFISPINFESLLHTASYEWLMLWLRSWLLASVYLCLFSCSGWLTYGLRKFFKPLGMSFRTPALRVLVITTLPECILFYPYIHLYIFFWRGYKEKIGMRDG